MLSVVTLPTTLHTTTPATCPLVQVRSINQRFAKVDILCIGAVPLEDTFSGMIRCVDVPWSRD